MNLFEKGLRDGSLRNASDVKRLFWRLARKLHPDVSMVARNEELFIRLKSDYDQAITVMQDAGSSSPEGRKPDTRRCLDLFAELVASNFPVDISIRESNKRYRQRIEELNAELGLFGGDFRDLLTRVESELYILRGPTTVSNHVFSLVKLHFYNIADSIVNQTPFRKHYLQSSHDMLIGVPRARKMISLPTFLDSLFAQIVK